MVYKEIIVDADLCIKLGSSEKYRYLESLLPCLADRIYIHESVNEEVKTFRAQLDALINSGKVTVLGEHSLSAQEKAIYSQTYNMLAKVMINKTNPNKNKGEVSSLAMAKTKGIPYFATDEDSLQPIIDRLLNTGMQDIECKRIVDIVQLIKDGQLPDFARKDAKLIWIISGKSRDYFDKSVWPVTAD